MIDSMNNFIPDSLGINDVMNESLPSGAPTIENQEHRSNSSISEQDSFAPHPAGRKTIELDQQGLKARLEYLDKLLAVSQAVTEITRIQVKKNPENIRAAADLNIRHTITIRMAIKELADDIGLEMTQSKFERDQLPEFQLEIQKGFPLTKVLGKESEPLEPGALDEKLEWDINCGVAVKIPEHNKPKTTNLLVKPMSILNKLSSTSNTSRDNTATTTRAVRPSQLTKTALVRDHKAVRWEKFRDREDIYYVLEATKQAKDESAKKSKTISDGHIIPESAITEKHGIPVPESMKAWKCKSFHLIRDGAGLDAYMDSAYKTCVLCEKSRGKDTSSHGVTMDFGFSTTMVVLQIRKDVQRNGATLVWAGATRSTRIKDKTGGCITLVQGDVIREDLDKIPRKQVLGRYPADLEDIEKPKKRVRLSTGNEHVGEADDSVLKAWAS
ncbi:hypothetical protein yc1106_05195 [Curvularia clavata]|uniref:Uncharacterized protein n=1 Tax=Curvularia clavata TaxID=95742 RepID=A0A9Q8Z7P0_CURCL|nr:hypothetical protein yc1106_05195 [Curvularia clavata]